MACTSNDFSASILYDIDVRAGVRFDEKSAYFIRKVDGIPTSLAGWYASCEIRDSINGQLRLFLDTSNGGVVLNAVDGAVYIRITHEQTAALELRDEKGVYLLKLVDTNQEPEWFAWGKVTLMRWG